MNTQLGQEPASNKGTHYPDEQIANDSETRIAVDALTFAVEGRSKMNEDRIEGTATKFGGTIERTLGDMAQNGSLQGEGMINQAKGTTQDIYGQVKEAVNSAISEASPRLRGASQTAVATAKQSPVLAALAVGAVGYLLAWAVHGKSDHNR